MQANMRRRDLFRGVGVAAIAAAAPKLALASEPTYTIRMNFPPGGPDSWGPFTRKLHSLFEGRAFKLSQIERDGVWCRVSVDTPEGLVTKRMLRCNFHPQPPLVQREKPPIGARLVMGYEPDVVFEVVGIERHKPDDLWIDGEYLILLTPISGESKTRKITEALWSRGPDAVRLV